jgi:hypothetical protein
MAMAVLIKSKGETTGHQVERFHQPDLGETQATSLLIPLTEFQSYDHILLQGKLENVA